MWELPKAAIFWRPQGGAEEKDQQIAAFGSSYKE